MPTPKKKLPTGPIRIDPPPMTKSSELAIPQADSLNTSSQGDNLPEIKQDSSKQELDNQALKLVSGNQDSTLLQSNQSQELDTPLIQTEKEILDSRKQDSSINTNVSTQLNTKENVLLNLNALPQVNETLEIEPSGLSESSTIDSSFLDSSKQESNEQQIEYKKVAMRLSSEAVEKLQHFRASTGIPYEILVDVMVRNWENLSQRTQGSYLQQAKQLRVNRLLAGQEKTMKTMKDKYLKS